MLSFQVRKGCSISHNISTCRDVSFNLGLNGPIPATIGNLAQLTTLYALHYSSFSILLFLIRHTKSPKLNWTILGRIMAGCSFTGSIPKELGNLQQLSFL